MREMHGHWRTLADGRRVTSREWRIWSGMKQRCLNKRFPAYPDYGGRGIGICERWAESFTAFLTDMGSCPDGHSIDRINNDGDYEPSNTRWATAAMQVANRRAWTKGARVTREQAYEIRRRLLAGESTRALADEFGMTTYNAWQIKTSKIWRCDV